jgi:hypothetical protein
MEEYKGSTRRRALNMIERMNSCVAIEDILMLVNLNRDLLDLVGELGEVWLEG